jgi:hypothetical protein
MARSTKTPSQVEDILYETFYGGAVGGTVIALLFLLTDTLAGHALYTPSVMGSALFFGIAPEFATSRRLDAVALYTAVHFALSGLLGLVASLLVRRMGRQVGPSIMAALVLFGLTEVGVELVFGSLYPDVPAALGHVRIALINLAAAAATVAFLRYALRVEDEARQEARAHVEDVHARRSRA